MLFYCKRPQHAESRDKSLTAAKVIVLVIERLGTDSRKRYSLQMVDQPKIKEGRRHDGIHRRKDTQRTSDVEQLQGDPPGLLTLTNHQCRDQISTEQEKDVDSEPTGHNLIKASVRHKDNEKRDPTKPIQRWNLAGACLGCGDCIFYGAPPKTWKSRNTVRTATLF